MKITSRIALIAATILLTVPAYAQDSSEDKVVGVEATMSYESGKHERYSVSAGRFVLIHGDKGTLMLKTERHQDLGKPDFHAIVFAGQGYSAVFDTREDFEFHAQIINESEPGDIIHPFELMLLLDRIDDSNQVDKQFESSRYRDVVKSDSTTVEGDLNVRVIEVEYWTTVYDMIAKQDRLVRSPNWHRYEVRWRMEDRSDREVTVWNDTINPGQPVHFKDFRPAGEPEMTWYESGGVPIGTTVNTVGGVTPHSYTWQGQPRNPPFRYWGVVIGAVIAAVIVGLVVLRRRNPARARKDDPFAPIR